jgi:hypothetical protein
MRRLAAVLFVLILIGLLSSCSRKPSDEAVAKEIQAKIAASPETQDSQVAVDVREGKITLNGRAKSAGAKQELVKIAKEEPGGWTVNDETTVEEQGTAANAAPPTPAGRLTSTRTPPPPPPPPPQPIVLPAGTVLTIRTGQPLSSKTTQVGTSFTGSVATPISKEGKMVIPAGASVTGTVRDAKKAGRFKGGATLALALDSVTVKGHTYKIQTEFFSQETKGKGKRTAGVIVGGTGVGAAIGGIAGGGKGAAIGALTGAAAGTVGAALTGGNKNIELPSESALSFRLVSPLTVKPNAQEQSGQ